jgi:hypothetical protein
VKTENSSTIEFDKPQAEAPGSPDSSFRKKFQQTIQNNLTRAKKASDDIRGQRKMKRAMTLFK